MQKAVLAVENVYKTFLNGTTQLEVLKGISIKFYQGVSYAVTGVSGSGKSTLIQLLAGLDSPTAGQVSFCQKNLALASSRDRDSFLQHSIGLVFQQPYLIDELSVLENIMIRGLVACMPYDECKKWALELLDAVAIADKAFCKPLSLSGGQQQRVAIARAIFSKPVFLLADEPTGSLDERTGQDIVDLLLACRKEWGMGIIISSHDAYVALRMDTVYQLKDGLMTIKDL